MNVTPPITYQITKQELVSHQMEAINWLIGRCEDQMVRGWMMHQRDFIARLGEPINSEGAIYESR